MNLNNNNPKTDTVKQEPSINPTPDPYLISVRCIQCGTTNSVKQSDINNKITCVFCKYNFFLVMKDQAIAQGPPVYPIYTQTPPQQFQYSPQTGQIQYPEKKHYSWEFYPYIYFPLDKKGHAYHPIILKFVGIILIISTIFSIASMIVFALSPVILNFKGNGDLSGVVSVDSLQEGMEILVPSENVNISIDGNIFTHSDMEGKFVFRNLKSGEHQITFEKQGYITNTIKIFIIKGISDHIKVVLEKGTGKSESDQMLFKDWNDTYSYFYGHMIIIGVLSIFMFAGSVYTMKHKHFGLALVGSGFAGFMWFFLVENFLLINILLGIGSVFGIIALIFIMKNKNYFQNNDK